MSVEAMAVVLHHSRAKGTAKVVALGIANHEGDGGSYPAVSTLARYANVDERNVQRAIKWLVDHREIAVDVQQGGDHRTAEHERPNRYRILLSCPSWCDRTTGHKDTRKLRGAQLPLSTAVQSVDNGVTNTPPPLSTGVTNTPPGGVAPAPPKPSLEPSTPQQVVPQLQDTRACAECSQPADRCIPAQLKLRAEDRHTYRPRDRA